MTQVLNIVWNPSEGIDLGFFVIRFYSLMFVIAFGLGWYIMKKIFERENESLEKLDSLFIWIVLSTLIGARLGHVLFYDWEYFRNHLLEILLPFRFEPKFEFTGYQGLASHGAAIALLISLYLFSRNVIKKSYLWVLDRLSAAIAIGCTCIRLGNLVNHEMVGDITTVPWGFRFLYHDYSLYNGTWESIPVRHPAQLYEAICYFIAFLILLLMYWKMNSWKKPGFMFGSFLIFIFGSRFFIEYIKEGQTARDFELLINTGQMLSIPFIIAGIILIYRSQKNQETTL